MDPYIAAENIHRLQRVRTLYSVKAFQVSLLFFTTLEFVHHYAKKQNLYRNHFTDGVMTACLTYPVMRECLRR